MKMKHLEMMTKDNDNDNFSGEELIPVCFFNEYFQKVDTKMIHIIVVFATGKCLPTFYLSNKKFEVTKYRVWSDLFFSR